MELAVVLCCCYLKGTTLVIPNHYDYHNVMSLQQLLRWKLIFLVTHYYLKGPSKSVVYCNSSTVRYFVHPIFLFYLTSSLSRTFNRQLKPCCLAMRSWAVKRLGRVVIIRNMLWAKNKMTKMQVVRMESL